MQKTISLPPLLTKKEKAAESHKPNLTHSLKEIINEKIPAIALPNGNRTDRIFASNDMACT